VGVIEAIWNSLILFAVEALILLKLACGVAFVFEVRLKQFPDRHWHGG
jgi:hypothetical protein